MRSLFSVIALLPFVALSSFASTKITVEKLDTFLSDTRHQAKSDEYIATKLKDMQLIEQLTTPRFNSFVQYQPGPLTISQLRILAVDSSQLPPPPSDLPSDPAPDHATQAAIMARALDYVMHQYAHLPKLTADKQTIRFQNGIDHIHTNSSTTSNFSGGDPGMNAENPYLLMLGAHTTTALSENGIEIPPPVKQKDPAGQNGQISQGGPGPVLGVILVDAAKGDLAFLRWEMVNDRKVAVFSFSVNKKISHYKVSYCCFPVMENIGGAGSINASPNMPSMMAQPGGTNTNFKSFSANPGYHGLIFVDPDSGTIVRLITKADLKSTDPVQQEDVRIDYGPAEIDGTRFIVPVASTILTQVAPNGDAYVKYTLRRTLFDVTYQNYRKADEPAKPN